MQSFFNEIMDGYEIIVNTLFNDLWFIGNISIGYVLLTLAVFGIVIKFLIGRLH